MLAGTLSRLQCALLLWLLGIGFQARRFRGLSDQVLVARKQLHQNSVTVRLVERLARQELRQRANGAAIRHIELLLLRLRDKVLTRVTCLLIYRVAVNIDSL